MPDLTTAPTAPAPTDTTPAPSGSTSTATAAPAQPSPASPSPAPTSLIAGTPESDKVEVPEKYEFKMPEGISPDTKILEGFEPLAKELGLSNEKAQKLVDLYAQHTDSIHKAQIAELDQQREAWRAEVQKDPKHGENLSLAKRGLEAVATPEAMKLIGESWMGDHPAIIATFAKVGRMLSEHTILSGSETTKSQENRSPAEILYPGLAK